MWKEEIETQEVAKDKDEFNEKYSNDLSIFNSLVILEMNQVPENYKNKIKYIIKCEWVECYVVIFDQTIQEAMAERKMVNDNVQ